MVPKVPGNNSVNSIAKVERAETQIGLPKTVDANAIAQWKALGGKTWGLGGVEAQQFTYMMVDKAGHPKDWIVRLTSEGLCVVIRRQPDFEDMYTLAMERNESVVVVKRKGKPPYVGHSMFHDVDSKVVYPEGSIVQYVKIDSRIVLGSEGQRNWNMYTEQLMHARAKAIAGRLAYPGLIGNSQDEIEYD